MDTQDIAPKELLAALAETGTGKAKLKAAHDWLAAHGSNNTADLLMAMVGEKIWGEDTMKKAQAVCLAAHESRRAAV